MRQKMNLEGVWDFGWYGEEKPVFPVKADEATAVPGCFDVMEPHCGKRGWAVYRRNVEVGGNVKLSIDGMGLYGEVYLDGKLIGECKYAYMPEAFWFDAGEERVHELAVLIDNRVMEELRVELRPKHFFAPIHARIFERISVLLDKQMVVTPVTLKPYFEGDEAMAELGGTSYLAQLTADGQTLLHVAV